MDAHVEQILRGARERIDLGWTRGADARDGEGAPVPFWSSEARSWSLLGALAASAMAEGTRGDFGPALARAAVALARVADEWSLERWNDSATRSRADVLGAIDCALHA